MNRGLSILGVILVFIAVLLFWAVFSGGSLGGYTITDGNAGANILAMVFVVAGLPIGSGLAFWGLAAKRVTMAEGAGGQVMYRGGSSGVAKVGLALAIIALIVVAGVAVAMQSTISSQSNEIGTLSAAITSLQSRPTVASVNATPGVIAVRVDWLNTGNTGQDRFYPPVITVVQGDIVQVLFEENDTDAHTFTLYTPQTPYGFQINDTLVGSHNFLTSAFYGGSCINGTYTQDTASLTSNGVSTAYCVSGASLLSPSFLASHAASNFRIALNPKPALSFTPSNSTGNPAVVIAKIDYAVHYEGGTLAVLNGTGTGTTEIWGIGAFQAATPGVYEYFCDYHVSNGMFGYLVVLPNSYCLTNAAACGVQSS